ncbi:MAG TPA: ABC transporter permease [Ktedonobacteraceae bacterium]|nr:ABC transporter permease [Ktedonobacteraceae bacterium]
MHLRSILAIARKDTIDILLNKSTLVVLTMPIILAVLFLFVSKLIGGHATSILVYNPDQSRVVQVVSSAFGSARVIPAASPAEVQAAFASNGAQKDAAYDIGLIIPANFDSALQAGQRPQASLYVNESNVDPHQALLLQSALLNYARAVAHPQEPLQLNMTAINPPATANIGIALGTFYSAAGLLVSFMVGTSLMPGLLIEEKEKKTLRMLMVTPASFTDVVLGKLLIALVYQLLLSGIVLIIQGGLRGQISLVLLYALLGSCFSLALGLLFGGIFSTTSAAGAVGGFVSMIYIVPVLFVGPLSSLFSVSPVTQAIKVLPTYYIAEGAYNAMQSQGSLNSHLLDISIALASTIVLVMLTAWLLRRQASVAAAI